MSSRNRQGDHKPIVQLGLRYGMLFFIASEVMFFFAFFWAYFNFGVTEEAWPPKGPKPSTRSICRSTTP